MKDKNYLSEKDTDRLLEAKSEKVYRKPKNNEYKRFLTTLNFLYNEHMKENRIYDKYGEKT